MLKCLVSENDTVVETFLSESVLEEEYLQQEVITAFYFQTSKNAFYRNCALSLIHFSTLHIFWKKYEFQGRKTKSRLNIIQ